MKSILTVVLGCLLSCLVACTNNVKPSPQPVITTTKYVVKLPPKEFLTLPEPVKPIDPDTADQIVVSKWIIAKEEYSRKLEDAIIGIAKFFNDREAELREHPETQQ